MTYVYDLDAHLARPYNERDEVTRWITTVGLNVDDVMELAFTLTHVTVTSLARNYHGKMYAVDGELATHRRAIALDGLPPFPMPIVHGPCPTCGRPMVVAG